MDRPLNRYVTYICIYLLYPFQNILNFESRFKNVILINNLCIKAKRMSLLST